MLLRRLPRERIRSVDWDRIELAPTVPGRGPLVLHLSDPLGHTRADWRDAGGDDNTIWSDTAQADYDDNPRLN